MNRCTAFLRWEKEDSFYQIYTDGVPIRLWIMTDDIFRIRTVFDQDYVEASYLLVTTAWEDRLDNYFGQERQRIEPLAIEPQETDKELWFETATCKLVIQKNPLAFSLYDLSGERIYSDVPGRAYQKDHLGRIYHYSCMEPEDCFYGLGEKTGELDKNGRYFRFSPKDNLGYNPRFGDPMYKHIPFYLRLSSKNAEAVGLFYHNTYEAAMSLGDEISGYWPRYCYYTADGGDMDVFLIHGPTLGAIIERYTWLTGRTAMQPRKTLGYIGSTMYYSELKENCDQAILSFIDQVEEEGIPIDGFMLSSGYTTSPITGKRNVFTWNQSRFPDPEGFFKAMAEKGILVSPNVKPGVLASHPEYRTWEELGIFIQDSQGKGTQPARWWGGEGAYFDFTNPKAREVWISCLKQQLLAKGSTSVWNDNCEYDGIDDRLARYSFEGEGATHGQLKSVQPTLMSRLSAEALQELDPKSRPFVVCRSGSAGIQRYAQTWAGDNPTSFDALKYNVPTLLGLGLSGVANAGADIGGFFGPAPEEELFVRWVQNGIFQPRFSIHSCNNDNTVTEPWMYSGSTELIREAILLRYRMLPYWYSLLWQAHTVGSPMMRPLVYEFQQDRNCYRNSFDFLVGASLLVATVLEPKVTIRQVYLPSGCLWYDFYTHQVYQGGQQISVPVTLQTIPLFVREGAIIPLAPAGAEKDSRGIHWLIAPSAGQVSNFLFYEDDGYSRAYEEGDYCLTDVSVTSQENVQISFTHKGLYQSRLEEIELTVIHPGKGPLGVTVKGEPLPQFLHPQKFEQAKMGWHYSHSLQAVRIKYLLPQEDYQVFLSFEDFDLIGM